MDIGIIALTKNGANLGYKLHKMMNYSSFYVKDKFYREGPNVISFTEKMKVLVKDIFKKHDCLIFIMATGIVVRSIAPFINDKKTDPAVLVMDERGTHVISLLSGHLGGANEYTHRVANLLGANPVITTASDVSGTIAVDTLAMKLNCKIEDFSEATKVTAHIVNEERVGIKSQIPIDFHLPKNIEVQQEKIDNSLKGLILITNKEEVNKPIDDTVVLRPKNLIVGIGCRRNKEYEKIQEALEESFRDLNLSTKSIRHFATVDVKKDEVGIKKLADKFERPLKIVAREKVKRVEDKFIGSDFVKKTIGVSCVCEPVAFLTSNKGNFIQRKRAFDGITIAIFKEGDKNWT
ncbi:cobalt-precorrin 5A hydrolase [Anaeromicrobium sediminis]|uniref:Cobalamin biosynthesis protein CbiG n=1 Tax=Anaeromicrobium sediminis TaxID=1478221 RepID=A0A267MPF5_9FIRM|nr:cobalt-precorrin 5A hydrolase [Anaeromicrobium sediminis]PAB60778.1 hypothetical protein CCE28_04360 [Anaeromicrobium sediminis]